MFELSQVCSRTEPDLFQLIVTIMLDSISVRHHVDIPAVDDINFPLSSFFFFFVKT